MQDPPEPSRAEQQPAAGDSQPRTETSSPGPATPEPAVGHSEPDGAEGAAAERSIRPEPARLPPNVHPLPPRKGEAAAAAEAVVNERLARTSSSPRHRLEAWLAGMVKSGASDLILRAGGRPSQRIDGRIHFLPGRVPGPGPLLEVLEGILGPKRMETWRERGSVDAALHLDGLGRFRLNAYKQMGEPAVVVRRVSEAAPTLTELNLPAEELRTLALKRRGLMLVTGVAGSGKSTTLAAMIQYVNNTVERHVITLEDPVELLFQEHMCVISQREVGTDCTDFEDGLRHALRQSPDILLIGEMRDAETVTAALDATETGHMVMSTLHTVNAPQTVDRILSFFPPEQHQQVRMRLADNLAGVLSQRLLPRADGKGMVPAYELLISTPHVRELLTEGKTAELARAIELGSEKGLTSFNECLRRLVVERAVDLQEALAASDRPDELVLALRGITGSAGRPTRQSYQAPPSGGGGERPSQSLGTPQLRGRPPATPGGGGLQMAGS